MNLVAIFSGGMDSTVLLHHLRSQGHRVKAIAFDYGQRHRVELDAARQVADTGRFDFEVIDISSIAPAIAGQSSQLNPDVEVPEGHYAADNMKATVVPNRNMIFLSIAIGHAVALEFDGVAYGAHAGDHTIYPDCRGEFVDAMRHAAKLCDWREIELMTPFVDQTKGDIARLGGELGVRFELTWSCYKGGDRHCGRCGTCVERQEAFADAGLVDPTSYVHPCENGD